MEIPSLSLQRKGYEVKAILAQEDSVFLKRQSCAPKHNKIAIKAIL